MSSIEKGQSINHISILKQAKASHASLTQKQHKESTHTPVDSIREAVFTVSPNKQYLGMVKPTTPAQHGPI